MADGKTYYTVDRVEVPPTKPGELRLASAAVQSCGLCGFYISGSGGGGTFICMPCGEALERGALVGCVKWDPVTER